MKVAVIGISHHTAAVAAREQFALPGGLAGEFLHDLRAQGAFEEAMVLDTCNRTEVYFVPGDGADPLKKLLACIERVKGVRATIDPDAFYRRDGQAAATHLFRVAAGLESQIVGEHQILGQIKTAYQLALKNHTARFLLNKMLHRAFRVGKRIRTETQLGRGSTSVAHAAVDLAGHIFSSLEGKVVLLVGAGETAELAARVLMRCKVSRVIVANRTLSRAQEVAANLLALTPTPARSAVQADVFEDETDDPPACVPAAASPGGTETGAIQLAQIPDVIAKVDLVICSTAAPGVVLKCEELEAPLRRSNRSVFIVDIAVPRDVDSRLGRLDNVFLYNMDDLDRLVAQNIQHRRQEIPLAEAIVADEVQRFVAWTNSLSVAPTIRLLQRRLGQLRKAEIGRYGCRFCPDDREQLEKFAGGLCSKMLHQPISFLRKLAEGEQNRSGDQLAAVDMIRRMFELDSVEDDG